MLKKFCDVCEKEMPRLDSGYEITHVGGKIYACSWPCVLQLQNVMPVTSVNSLDVIKTYAASDYQVFANGNIVANQNLVQGAFGGRNYISIAYFDTRKICADLDNLAILSVHLTVKAEHWYHATGGTAVIGTKNFMRLDSLVTDELNADRVLVGGMKHNSTYVVELPLEIGFEFQSGSSGGIVFGSESANSEAFYGKFVAKGKDTPMLSFTCTKQNPLKEETSFKAASPITISSGLPAEVVDLVLGNALSVQGN